MRQAFANKATTKLTIWSETGEIKPHCIILPTGVAMRSVVEAPLRRVGCDYSTPLMQAFCSAFLNQFCGKLLFILLGCDVYKRLTIQAIAAIYNAGTRSGLNNKGTQRNDDDDARET